MRRLFTLFQRPPVDFSATIAKAIVTDMHTTQQARNLALLIESHVYDEKKRKQLHALLTVLSAARGLCKVNIKISLN